MGKVYKKVWKNMEKMIINIYECLWNDFRNSQKQILRRGSTLVISRATAFLTN